MDWIIGALVSAFFLGFYDLLKKHAVEGNAVLPVLFLSACFAAIIWLPSVLATQVGFIQLGNSVRIDPLSLGEHLMLFLKSAIVSSSWICSYFALKHLPISLAAPIRATSPLWTVLGAGIILGERHGFLLWVGVLLIVGGMILLSLVGRKEGINFRTNRWVWAMVGATLLGSSSAMYDRYLLGFAGFSVPTVQAWFSIYNVVFMIPLILGWKLRMWTRGNFQWRWSIPLIGFTLLIADYAYFWALSSEDAMISIVSCLRRASTLVAFAGGIFIFKEHEWKRKLRGLAFVLAGLILVILGRP